MECGTAREQLSAWVDGERTQVSRARLDKHLRACPGCRDWLAQTRRLNVQLGYARARPADDLAEQILAAAALQPLSKPARLAYWARHNVNRCALVLIGIMQLGLAVLQVAGVNFGMVAAAHHGHMSGEHLMNESTAWLLALGAGMIVAGVRPDAAAGMVAVLGVFAVVLTGYVISDAIGGEVTAARVISHLPILLGLLAALLVWQDYRSGRTPPTNRAVFVDEPGYVAEPERHLRSADNPADHPAA